MNLIRFTFLLSAIASLLARAANVHSYDYRRYFGSQSWSVPLDALVLRDRTGLHPWVDLVLVGASRRNGMDVLWNPSPIRLTQYSQRLPITEFESLSGSLFPLVPEVGIFLRFVSDRAVISEVACNSGEAPLALAVIPKLELSSRQPNAKAHTNRAAWVMRDLTALKGMDLPDPARDLLQVARAAFVGMTRSELKVFLARKRRIGYTKSEIAKRAGMPVQQLSRYSTSATEIAMTPEVSERLLALDLPSRRVTAYDLKRWVEQEFGTSNPSVVASLLAERGWEVGPRDLSLYLLGKKEIGFKLMLRVRQAFGKPIF